MSCEVLSEESSEISLGPFDEDSDDDEDVDENSDDNKDVDENSDDDQSISENSDDNAQVEHFSTSSLTDLG